MTRILIVLALVATGAFGAEPDHKERAREMIQKATAWLRTQQDAKTGGWAHPPSGPVFPAITALVVNGMVMTPGFDATKDESVVAGVRYILSFRKPDGGIYDSVLPSYNTSIALSALAHVGTPEARAAIKPAQEFLRQLQFGEGAFVDGQVAGETGRVGPEHPFYGGVGYGSRGRPDNSNLSMFIQAMRDSGVDKDDAAYQRALVFLSRTQMLDGVNNMPYADGSTQGGFIYSTSASGERRGEGQSFAGEIEESLSGPPGTVALVRLHVKDDGSPRLMTRDELVERLRAAMAESRLEEVRAAEFKVLLGPTADGASASEFEVRSSVTKADLLLPALTGALTENGKLIAGIEVGAVPAWKGVSRLRAYGSMTYAGFKSYVFAQLERDDPRVLAAYDWIRANYTVDENPGVGTDGLYYYFVTFARALDAWGEPTVMVLPREGSAERTVTPRDWSRDLIDRLEGLQNADGSFRSVDDRWLENNPVLITAYAVIALQHAAR